MTTSHHAATRSSGDITRARIVDAIRNLSAESRRAPTVRQIAEHIGSKSTGHISWHLTALRRQGIVEPSDGHAGILLTQEHGA